MNFFNVCKLLGGLLLMSISLPVEARSRLVDQGGEAFNIGNYQLAIEKWTKAAKRGDPFGYLNMGMLFENGIGSQPKDLNIAAQWYLGGAQRGHFESMVALSRVQIALGYPDAALSWLNYAARWSDSGAINELHKLGQPVPSADLLSAHQQNQQVAQAQMGYALGCIIGGGCPPSGSQSRVVSYARKFQLQSEWYAASTDKMCRFENGTVLNVGSGRCPPAIEGPER